MEAIPSELISFAAADGLYCSNASDIIGRYQPFHITILTERSVSHWWTHLSILNTPHYTINSFNWSFKCFQFGSKAPISEVNASLCNRIFRCNNSCTTIYSIHESGFLASSRLKIIFPVRWLQLPQSVLICFTSHLVACTPITRSHLTIRGNKISFNCFLYHSRIASARFSIGLLLRTYKIMG